MAFKKRKRSSFSVDGTDGKVDRSQCREMLTPRDNKFGSDQATFVVHRGVEHLDLEAMTQQLMELWQDCLMDQQSHSTIDQITLLELQNILEML